MESTTNQRKEHVGYNSIAVFIRLVVVASQICEILRKFELIAVQGHPRSLCWCQPKAHIQLPISHS